MELCPFLALDGPDGAAIRQLCDGQHVQVLAYGTVPRAVPVDEAQELKESEGACNRIVTN